VRFALSETQEAVAGVADQALGRPDCSWEDLAEAGLLALPLPERCDGEGLGLPEVAVLLRAVGSHAAVQLPVWETLVCGVLPLIAHGSPAQLARLLPGVASGGTQLTAALSEPGSAIPAAPRTALTRDGDGWRLDGHKVHVSGAAGAAAILVSAIGEDGPVVALVDPSAEGVRLVETRSSREVAEHTLPLDGVRLPDDDLLDAAETLRRHAIAGFCLLGDGLLAGARDLTASYVKGRRQFGRALAEFQGLQWMLADMAVKTEAMRLLVYRAATQLAAGHPDGPHNAAIAKAHAGEAAFEVVDAAMQLHGGYGYSSEYPLERMLRDVRAFKVGGGSTATRCTCPGRPVLRRSW